MILSLLDWIQQQEQFHSAVGGEHVSRIVTLWYLTTGVVDNKEYSSALSCSGNCNSMEKEIPMFSFSLFVCVCVCVEG